MKPVAENESRHLGQNEMAGLKGKSGPPGNMNAFKHGLAAIQKRREEAVTTEHEESVRQQILEGLIADKGGDQQISTATRILAEVIVSDAACRLVFKGTFYYRDEFLEFVGSVYLVEPCPAPIFGEWLDRPQPVLQTPFG
jgi:hypothetical protein